jgi:hypothetical protein
MTGEDRKKYSPLLTGALDEDDGVAVGGDLLWA